MRSVVLLWTIALMAVLAAGADGNGPPPWAYPINPAVEAPKDDGTPKRVPNSNQVLTLTQIREIFSLPDWHPEEHPVMPEVVARGRKPNVRPCGYCHLPNGQGRPENASLAGLPAAYIVQQIADFRRGARKSSEPKMSPPSLMAELARHVTDADLQLAAEYFASLKPKPWIRVIESNTVPKTHVSGSMLVRSEEGGTEPIGNRIIEVPEDLTRTELRDSQSGFVAYVPGGSIKRGETLVKTGGAKVSAGNIVPGKTTQCGICHGADLRGLGVVPSLAGRSPSYIIRQLYDMKHGTRAGLWTELMKGVVAQLSEEDMVSIAAYTSSLAP